jgi:hypothetical protein
LFKRKLKISVTTGNKNFNRQAAEGGSAPKRTAARQNTKESTYLALKLPSEPVSGLLGIKTFATNE